MNDIKLKGFEHSYPQRKSILKSYDPYELELFLNDRYVFGQKGGVFFRINIDKFQNGETDLIIIDTNDLEELKTYNRWKFSSQTILLIEDGELKDFFELVNESLDNYINQ